MIQSLDGIKRTKYCGEFTKEDIGKEVTLMGWVDTRRDFGNLIFIDLRDTTGVMQVVFDKEKFEEDFSLVETLRNEFVILSVGNLVKREEDTVNEKLKTGLIEVRAKKLKILSLSKPLPFSINDDRVKDSARLQYRYLDLRREKLQKNLKLRNEVYKIVREYLDAKDFIEVETPMLGKSTPEGARDYLVPSRTFPNHFFALPQSPQLYKQLLMLSGVNRYFQIAKCFRDEDLRADRQPEFTQIDMEISFVDKEEQVMQLVEELIVRIFKQTKNIILKTPFVRMTYDEAMDKYGSDKPDTRFDLKLVNISDIALKCSLMPFQKCVEKGGSVRVLNGKDMLNKLTKTELEKLVTFVKEFGAKGLSYVTFENDEAKSPLIKYFKKEEFDEILTRANMQNNDVLFFVADEKDDTVLKSLGKLRLHLAERFKLIDNDSYAPLWVVDFPLFEYDEQEKRYVAKHHPFTAPKDEHISYIETAPEKVRAKAYDIVVNGYELGGGSIRIFEPSLQQKMFTALGFTKERIEKSFGFFVEAFEYGAPPHGGLAIGLDRLMMLLTKTDDIKDVIAFPKVQSAMDLLTKAPGVVTKEQLEELFLKLKPLEEE